VTDFFRFPHTPHIAWLASGAPRDDKVLSPTEIGELLAGDVVVEEKLDGANLGFSVSADGYVQVQNRGQYLKAPYHGQFAKLVSWLYTHEDRLFDALGNKLMAFGEWCAARHSLTYAELPDWWLLFDIYDRSANRFWSTLRRDAWAQTNGFLTVPCLYRGPVTPSQLSDDFLDRPSCFRSSHLEGVVIRKEDAFWLQKRAKLVRADFSQAIDSHWRSRPLEWNQLKTRSELDGSSAATPFC
jgi:ATP-dependent RNA circularization protein (DNA/RNA ligase family)